MKQNQSYFKSLALLLITTLSVLSFPSLLVQGQNQKPEEEFRSAASPYGLKQKPPDERIIAAQRQALEAYGPDVHKEFDNQSVPSFLMGRLSARINKNDPVAEAKSALEIHGAAFRRGPDDNFIYRTREKEAL